MVTFIEGLAPVGEKVDNSCGSIVIVSCREDKINHFDQGMGAGGALNSELIGINELPDIKK